MVGWMDGWMDDKREGGWMEKWMNDDPFDTSILKRYSLLYGD